MRAIRSFVSGNTIVPRQGRIGWVLVVLLFQVISSIGEVYQTHGAWCVGAISKVEGLRVREKPSDKSKVIARLSRGEFVGTLEEGEKIETINDIKNVWCKIRKSPDVVGWVFGGYLDFLDLNRFDSAVEAEDYKTLALMVKHGYNVNSNVAYLPTSFHRVCCGSELQGDSNASVRMVDFLIKNGGFIGGCLEDYCMEPPPPLVCAEKPEIIRKLIEAGSTPEVKMAALETELKPHCFGVGQKEKVKILLDEGHVPLAPCTPGERGYCLEDLFFAFGGDPEMIAYTIEKGANVNYKLPGGGTPYMFALYNTYSEAMDLLVKHGAKIEGVREVELLKAVERGDYQKTTELVKKVSDLNLGSLFEKEKSTLFDLAFQGAPKSPKNGQKDYGIVRLLINSGASVNDVRILNTYGYNDRRSQGVWYQSPPLVLAIESGQLDLVKRFVKAGANLNFIFGVENPEAITPVFTKFTPLDFAIPGSDIEVYLIKEGAKRRKDLP